ncbi:hypothetical protein B0J14DRAFT_649550 [Halenospora varia]|nr:hypothetical protein B0J14DRAFT_649550 [Halenospora varia]
MSSEDNLEEVYTLLSRTFSEDAHLSAQQEAELHQISLDENNARKLSFDLQQQNLQSEQNLEILNALERDLDVAREWLERVIGEDDGEGDEDMEGVEVMEGMGMRMGSRTSPLAELRRLAAFAGETNDPEGSDNQESMPMDHEQLILRTGKRLQSDALRLLKPVKLLLGKEDGVSVTDLDWLVVYLEGRVRLLRGELNRGGSEEERRGWGGVNYSQVLEAQLPSLVDFAELRWRGSKSIEPHEGQENRGGDHQGEKDGNESLTRELMKELLEPTCDRRAIKESSPSRKEVMERRSGREVYAKVRELGIKNNQNRSSLEANLAEALNAANKLMHNSEKLQLSLAASLNIANKLYEENLLLQGALSNANSRIIEEEKSRRAMEFQIQVLSKEGQELRQGLIAESKAIIENARSERDYRMKRNMLEEEMGIAQAESKEEAAEQQKVFDALEEDRRRAWLSFVLGLEAVKDADIEMMKALWVAKSKGLHVVNGAVSEQPVKGSCLYCASEDCGGCGGMQGIEFGL